jgi:hypothetical protein
MKKSSAVGPLAKWMLLSSSILVAMFSAPSVANAEPRFCSNATLNGAYGFFVQATLLPAGTPRSILGVLTFDGKGTFTATLTFNDDGVISTPPTDKGPYYVNADCTGQLTTNGGAGTVAIVIVDGGNEFYQLRTIPATTFFQFNSAKKQFPGDNQ